MATVIDRLVVELGLDPKQFTKGQKEAAASIVKTRETAQKQGAGIEKSMDGASEAVDKLARNALKLFAIFTAGRAIKDFVTDVTSADSALGRLAKSVGSTPDVISSLSNAVARNGGSASAAAGSFERLADSINEIKTTGNSSILPYLYRLQGLGGKQINLNKEMSETFGDLAENAKNIADKQGIPFATYLLKQAGVDRDTAALLVQGRQAYNRALAESRKLGIVRKEDTEAAQKLQTTMESLRQTSEGFGRTVMTALTPTINDLLERMQRWITVNQDWIKTEIVEKVRQFAEWLKSIDWDGVGKGLRDFGNGALKVADQFGGILKICEALFVFWVGSKAIAIVASILKVAGLLSAGPLGWAIRLAMAASFASDLAVPNAEKPGVITRSDDENTGAAVAPSGGAGRDPRLDRDRGAVRDWAGRAWRRVKGFFGGGSADAAEGGGGIRVRANRAKRGPDGIPYEAKTLTEGLGINQKQYDAYREGLTDIEGKSYTQTGGAGGRYSGRYQFGPNEIRQTALKLGEDPPTRQQFLSDPAMQERYMERYTLDHHNYLMRKSEEYRNLSAEKKLEILGYAHNQGEGGAAKYLRTGQAGSDGFGTSGTAYFGPIRRRLAQLAPSAMNPDAPQQQPAASPPPQQSGPTLAEAVTAVQAAKAAQREKQEREAAGQAKGAPATTAKTYLGGRTLEQMNKDFRLSRDGKAAVPTDWQEDKSTGQWKPVFGSPADAKARAALDARRAGAAAAIAQVQAAQAATVNSTSNDNRSTSTSETNINGPINIHTAAQDAGAIARDIGPAMKRHAFAAAANYARA